MRERILLPLPVGMTARIDAARGDESRVAFIRRAIASHLEPPERHHSSRRQPRL